MMLDRKHGMNGRCITDTLLEDSQVILSERVGLGDDWNQVNSGPEALHDLDVEGLEAGRAKIT